MKERGGARDVSFLRQRLASVLRRRRILRNLWIEENPEWLPGKRPRPSSTCARL